MAPSFPSSTRCRRPASRCEAGGVRPRHSPPEGIPKRNPADVTDSHGRRETSQKRGKLPVVYCLSPTVCPLANPPGTAIDSRNAEPSSSPFTSRTKTPRRRLWAASDCTRPRATRPRGAASEYTRPIVMNILRATVIAGPPWRP